MARSSAQGLKGPGFNADQGFIARFQALSPALGPGPWSGCIGREEGGPVFLTLFPGAEAAAPGEVRLFLCSRPEPVNSGASKSCFLRFSSKKTQGRCRAREDESSTGLFQRLTTCEPCTRFFQVPEDKTPQADSGGAAAGSWKKCCLPWKKPGKMNSCEARTEHEGVRGQEDQVRQHIGTPLLVGA